MKKKHTISVVVPLYNHARYIESALQSVLSQTIVADEIIVIDDGSSDNGYDLAQAMLAKVPHAKILKQKNTGAHHAINRAIELSNSKYIAILNSDDIFVKTKLARCLEMIQQQPHAELFVGKVGIIDEHNTQQRSGVAVDWLKRAQDFFDKSKLPQLSLLNENFIATTSNMVFSRSLWQVSGGFQPLRYCHDLDFMMFAYQKSEVVLDLDYEHIMYRVHNKNTIQEDIGKIRIEIAAVIAQTLSTSGPLIFSPRLDHQDFLVFTEFLKNKQLTDIVCFFQTILPAFSTRKHFYEHIAGIKPDLFFNNLCSV